VLLSGEVRLARRLVGVPFVSMVKPAELRDRDDETFAGQSD